MCKILAGRPEGKRPIRRLRYGWEDDIKTDVKDWWQTVVNPVMKYLSVISVSEGALCFMLFLSYTS